jgi:two-component system phosphate regulon sensor histidine kinase PhoR
LNDVTALRRLETVRRDFVANVSHELKTPITSIKGFVETLLDTRERDAQETERFLGIVLRQADRLNAIIEDLLNLSRIERDAEAGDIALEQGALRAVVAAALQSCETQAQTRGIRLVSECDAGLAAWFNGALLEQALVNLIDNAIKYSPAGAEVRVEAAEQDGSVVIRVRDWGSGIEAKHLPRLFERFYRVDKARSRKLGGTGLGLAIVKHIAQAHKGQVFVESAPGAGSTFSLHFPTQPRTGG